jgi:hypothetical protein
MKKMKNSLDNRTCLAVDYRPMREAQIIRKLRSAVALGLILWCAGTGCVLVSYAHGATMSRADLGGASSEKGLGSVTASAGSHDCCKARHPALKRTARSQTNSDGTEQVALPESSAPDGARSCCPLTSGSFVTASRSNSNESNVSSVTRSFVPPSIARTGAAPADYPLHLPNQNKAYLIDCVFLI